MLRRRRAPEGRRRVFLAPRPVPTRLAGYNPVAPLETRRVPPTEPPVTPAPPQDEVLPPPYFPGWPSVPPVIPPPVVVIPPGEPPCDEDNPDDEECPPEEPPVDAPEPGLPLLLFAGAVVYVTQRLLRKAPPAA